LQVPFDSTGGASIDDEQHELNGFENLSWQHEFGSAAPSHSTLFVAAYNRHGSLDYLPGASDTPQFVFYPDTVPRNLEEHRSFQTSGLKADYTARPSHAIEWKAGIQTSITTGHENFTTTTPPGTQDRLRTRTSTGATSAFSPRR
jgi:hypothetical protein